MTIVVATTAQWLDWVSGPSVMGIFEAMADLGYSVKLIFPSSTAVHIRRYGLEIVAVRVRKWLPFVTLAYVWFQFLRLMLREPKLSVLIADHHMFPLVVAVKLLRQTRIVMLNRSVPMVMGFLGKITFFHFRVLLTLTKYTANLVTATTPLWAEEFSRLGRIPIRKIVVIPSVVSAAFNEYKPRKDKSELRRELGISRSMVGKRIVLYHGVLDAKRGILDLVQSFKDAFDDQDDVVLLIVGQGPAKESILSLVKRSGITNCVVLDRVPYATIPKVISACDLGLVILPDMLIYRYECPIKLVELLAMRKPVIASDLPGMRWGAGDSSLVTYVHSFNGPELKRAVTSALNLNHAPSQANRNEFYRRFASEQAARKLLNSIGQSKLKPIGRDPEGNLIKETKMNAWD